MSRWHGVTQWFYPPPFRIEVAHRDATAVLLVASLADVAAMMAKASATAAPPPANADKGAATGGALDRGFVVDVCNHFHRLGRSARRLQEEGGSEAKRLIGNLDQVRKMFQAHDIECVDLTGQGYDAGRSDFEPLGEPQVSPGLSRMTIIQCERPLVLFKGKLVQAAKGVVGRPG